MTRVSFFLFSDFHLRKVASFILMVDKFLCFIRKIEKFFAMINSYNLRKNYDELRMLNLVSFI